MYPVAQNVHGPCFTTPFNNPSKITLFAGEGFKICQTISPPLKFSFEGKMNKTTIFMLDLSKIDGTRILKTCPSLLFRIGFQILSFFFPKYWASKNWQFCKLLLVTQLKTWPLINENIHRSFSGSYRAELVLWLVRIEWCDPKSF